MGLLLFSWLFGGLLVFVFNDLSCFIYWSKFVHGLLLLLGLGI